MSGSYNGTTQYLDRGSAAVTAFPFTFAAWFNTGATSGTLIRTITSNGLGVAAIDLTGTTVRAFVGSATVQSGTYTLNVWNHAAGYFNSATDMAVYLNGTKTATATSAALGTVTGTRIGATSTPSAFFNGTMAFAAIWNIRVTDGDITALSKGIDPFRISPQAIVAYVPQIFDAGLGIDLARSSAWTLNGSGPTYSATDPTTFMRMGRSNTVPFFAIQNGQITFTPTVTLTLGASTGQQGGPPYEFWGGGHR